MVEQPTQGTTILEMAITQVVPGNVWLGAVGLASNAFGPVGIATGAIAATGNPASMAIEGRMRDSSNQSIWAVFSDNEPAKTSVVDLRAVTWYGHTGGIMDDWASQFAQIANGPREVTVMDASFFTLKPW